MGQQWDGNENGKQNNEKQILGHITIISNEYYMKQKYTESN